MLLCFLRPLFLQSIARVLLLRRFLLDCSFLSFFSDEKVRGKRKEEISFSSTGLVLVCCCLVSGVPSCCNRRLIETTTGACTTGFLSLFILRLFVCVPLFLLGFVVFSFLSLLQVSFCLLFAAWCFRLSRARFLFSMYVETSTASFSFSKGHFLPLVLSQDAYFL